MNSHDDFIYDFGSSVTHFSMHLLEVYKYLLQYTWPPYQQRSRQEKFSLTINAMNNHWIQDIEVIKLALGCNSLDKTSVNFRTSQGTTLMHGATASLAKIFYSSIRLGRKKADFDESENSCVESLKEIVKAGADLHIQDDVGRTPFSWLHWNFRHRFWEWYWGSRYFPSLV